MGSGFTTFSAGSVLTASQVNNYLMQQSIMYFATTAARDAAITSPVRGMTVYVASGDANEGLYSYNGTSWRKGASWNSAWGQLIAEASSATNVTTSGTTEKIIKTSSSFTAVANRNYLVIVTGTILSDTGGDVYTLRTRLDSVSGTILGTTQQTIAANNGPEAFNHSYTTTIAAGSHTINFTMQRASGTGSGSNASLAIYFTVLDVGPATGAPS